MSSNRVLSNRRSVLVCFALAHAFYLFTFSGLHAGTLVGVGQDPAPPTGPFVGDDNNNDMIMVGTASDPIPVVLDPSGPAWTKQFTINRDGQGWSPTGPSSTVNVMEWLTFPPGTTTLRPTDWHETIVPTAGDGANFKWAGGSILIGTSTYPATLSGDGKSIWFDFPPIPPSAPPVKINKDLMWTGGVITPGPNGSNNYVITVTEQPSVPEPSTVILISLMVAGMAIVVRSHRK